ncbi:MAG: EI24 domain-containing protein, partial [Sphingomonadaceae bacterium]
MIRALSLSIGQLTDPAILKVLAKVLAITLALFLLLGVALWRGGAWLSAHYGWGADGGMAAAAGAAIIALLSAWLLFRVVAIAITGLFADAVIEAVERRHYPDALASARAPGMALSLQLGLASA